MGIGRFNYLVKFFVKVSTGNGVTACGGFQVFCIDGGKDPGGGEYDSCAVLVEFQNGSGQAAEFIRADGNRNVFTIPGYQLIAADSGCRCLFARVAEQGARSFGEFPDRKSVV